MNRMVACLLCAAIGLSACGRGDPQLFNARSQDRTPDEFSILPTQPLTMPEDLSVLPPPNLGGRNLTDRQPEAEAIAALGGNPAGGVGADGALVAAVSRYGVQDNIRGQLAAEDLEYRRANNGRLLERVFNVNIYYDAYAPQSLDQHRELERLRSLGVRTVAAPPDPVLVQ
ncbi:MAG: DUF3035 domain-containing protein [Pseudomonadota bacterium]